MAKKKKNEPIVIDKTELIPTTLGSLETKENGPLVAIIWVVLFVVCIVALPYVTEYFTNSNNNTPTSSNPSKDNPTTQTPVTTEPEEEKYYEISNDVIISEEGFQITELTLKNQTLNFLITNINGSSTYFTQNDYYIELYDDDATLLQRIKFDNVAIVNSRSFSYDIKEAYQNGTPTKLSFIQKEEQDYPQVTLSLNKEKVPVLTCQKEERTITYLFESESSYLLKSIETEYTYSSSNNDYESVLTTYSTLTASYNTFAGVTAELSPIATGFTFYAVIDLASIPSFTYTNNFTESYYYPANTEAKVIAFELGTSGYSCN